MKPWPHDSSDQLDTIKGWSQNSHRDFLMSPFPSAGCWQNPSSPRPKPNYRWRCTVWDEKLGDALMDGGLLQKKSKQVINMTIGMRQGSHTETQGWRWWVGTYVCYMRAFLWYKDTKVHKIKGGADESWKLQCVVKSFHRLSCAEVE